MKQYLAILSAIALLGAGCSAPVTPPTNPPQAAANPEARCDALMTLDEAKLITGLTYTQRDATTQTAGKALVTNCTFYDGGSRSGIKPFGISTRSASSIDEAKTIFETSKKAAYADGQMLSGLGDQALWSPSISQVSLIQGQTWLIVTASNNKELAIKIAETILPKLK